MTMNDMDQELDQDRDESDNDIDDFDGEEDDFDGESDDNGEADADGEVDGEARADSVDADGTPRPRRRRRGRSNGPREDYVPVDDERASTALEFVLTVIDNMEMDCRVRLRRPKEGEENPEIHIEITGPDAGRVIGKKGQVLTALQYLTHRVVNRAGVEKRHVLVDAEGYRSRRDNSLASMARRLGKQAVEQGKIITFEPMNPRDRRVVHLALAKFEGVITKSDGEGASRRVQIIPVRRTTA
jgi:spoIIIJ-associated protein